MAFWLFQLRRERGTILGKMGGYATHFPQNIDKFPPLAEEPAFFKSDASHLCDGFKKGPGDDIARGAIEENLDHSPEGSSKTAIL